MMNWFRFKKTEGPKPPTPGRASYRFQNDPRRKKGWSAFLSGLKWLWRKFYPTPTGFRDNLTLHAELIQKRPGPDNGVLIHHTPRRSHSPAEDYLDAVQDYLDAREIEPEKMRGYILKGAERNVIVYDEMAHQNQFTSRLVALMKMVARKTCLSRLKTLFVPPEAELVCEEEHIGAGGTFLGVRLRAFEGATEFYPQSPGRILHPRKNTLVVGLLENGEVLLGCY